MDNLLNLYAEMTWESISWRMSATLFHFLWQAILIGGCIAVLLRFVDPRNSNMRYLISLSGLFLLPLVALTTFLLIGGKQENSGTDPLRDTALAQTAQNTSQVLPSTATEIKVSPGSANSIELPEKPAAQKGSVRSVDEINEGGSADTNRPSNSNHAPSKSFGVFANAKNLSHGVAILYLVGSSLMLLRLSFLLSVSKKRHQGLSLLPENHDLVGVVNTLAGKLGIHRPLSLAIAKHIQVPSVVGIIKPILLLPPAAITGLSRAELESIILHELAHIRRFDPAVHLLQRVIEAVFFFHPVVWRLSKRVSLERENCCDDVAAKTGSGFLGYAKALLKMAELCVTPGVKTPPVGLMAATGVSASGLSTRVERLLATDSSRQPIQLSRKMIFAVAFALAVSGFAIAWFHSSFSSRDSQVMPVADRAESQTPSGKSPIQDAQDKSTNTELDDVAAAALKIINAVPKFELRGGSWQSGAHDAMVQYNLGQLNPREVVVKFLLEEVKQGNQLGHDPARHALAFLGTYAPKRLVPILKTRLEKIHLPTSEPEIYEELRMLGLLGEEAKSCIPVLVKLVKTSTINIRRAAVEAMVLIDPDSAEVIQAVANELKERNKYHRSFVVYELSRFGTAAKQYEDELKRLLDDDYHQVQIWAALALVKTESDPKTGFDFLLRKLKNGSREEKKLAATALASLGTRGSNCLMKLQGLLETEKLADVRKEIFEALERIKNDDRILTHAQVAKKRKDQRKAVRKANEAIKNVEDKSEKGASKTSPNSHPSSNKENENLQSDARSTEHRQDKKGKGKQNEKSKAVVSKVYWGKAKDGIRMGIQKSFLMKPGMLHAGDRVHFDVLVANESDKTIHIRRDLNMHYRQQKLDGKKVDLTGQSIFMSFFIPNEAFQDAMISIKPNESATVLTSQFVVCVPGTKPGKYFRDPFCVANDKFEFFASHTFSYNAGGIRDFNRRDVKSVQLQSGATEIAFGSPPKL